MPDHLFNPPPGWPPPPAPDWTPPDGWVPDPSWPPAPEGWQWWLPPLEVTAIVPPPPNVEEAEARTVGATRQQLDDLAERLEVSKVERTARFEASQAARHDRTVERKQKTEDDRAARKARRTKPVDAQLTATVHQSTTPGAEPDPALSPQPADKPSWGERHAAKQSEKDRAKVLAVWQKDQDTLVRGQGWSDGGVSAAGPGDPPQEVLLRSPTLDDEAQVAKAQAELAVDGFEFVLQEAGESWAAYVARLERQHLGRDVAPGRVPSTFLLAVVNGDIVGRASIRHELNERLAAVGGHIGYAVRPAYRRRGYGRSILRQSLDMATTLGLRRVLLTCDDDNVVSARLIESFGGILENVVASDGSTPTRRYWIDLDSLAD